jgi:hypothetical protein
VCFSSFAGDGGPHRRQESEEEKKLSRIHPVSWIFGAGVWRRRAANVPAVPEVFPAIPRVFGVYFVIL